MLRASVAATTTPVDLRAVTDRSVDPALAGGRELLDLVDAVLTADPSAAAAREAVLAELGPEGLADAAGVIGNFEMMNRIADGTGIPVGTGTLARTKELRAELGLDHFRHG
jgi:hypothetical protein